MELRHLLPCASLLPAALFGQAPTITSQPANQVAVVGGNVSFTVGASGATPLVYQWFHNGAPLSAGTGATFAFGNAQLVDAGTYAVTVSNSSGSVNSNPATLSGPNPPPIINVPPPGLTVTAGQPVTLSVTASGTGTLSYVWRRNGYPLPDATASSFTIPAASRSDADYYDVLVGAGLSVTASNRIRLDVAPTAYAQAIAPDPAHRTVFETDGGQIAQFLPLADGRFFIAGSFRSINSTPRQNIARFNANGTLDTGFAGPDFGDWYSSINALAVQADGKVIVGGTFYLADAQSRSNLIRLNADGTLDPTFQTRGVGSDVRTIALQADGKILVGGYFSSYYDNNFSSTPRNRLARLNADGTLDASFAPEPNNLVGSLVLQSDGKIVVAGQFTAIAGQGRSYLARLNSDGTLDAAYAAAGGPSERVYALGLQADGKVLVGGYFTAFNGTAVGHIVRLDTSGALDATFSAGTGFDYDVLSLAVQSDGKILAGGYFVSFSGTYRPYLARLNANGTLDEAFSAGVGGSVNAVAATADGRILVAGGFTDVAGVSRNRLARLNGDGTLDGFSASARTAGSVNTSILLPGGRLLAGGDFTHINGVAVAGRNLARFNADGSLDATFNPGTGPNGVVNALLAQPDGRVVVGGTFYMYNGTVRPDLARINADGSLDGSFPAGGGGPNSGVTVLASTPGGQILVGGYFGYYNNVPRAYVARLYANGALDQDFTLPTAGSYFTVNAFGVTPEGKVYVGGSFSSIGGQTYNGLVRLNSNGTLDTAFANPAALYYSVTALALQPDGKVLAGSYYYGTGMPNLARFNPDGSRDTSFDLGTSVPNGGIYTIMLQPDGRIVAGGDFSVVGNVANTGYVARFNADGSRDPTLVTLGLRGAVRNLVVRDSGQFFLGGYQGDGGTFTAPASAPVIGTQPVSQTATAGATVTFSAAATGNPPPTYQWSLNGVPLAGATNATLTVTNVQLANAGGYTVTASNGLGSVTSNVATLSGSDPAPTISTQPQAATGIAGQPISLTVAATGAGTLTYQWRRNGVAIPGATGTSYTIASSSRTDAGVYDVVVASGLSIAVSQTVRVAVAPTSYPQVISADPNFSPTVEIMGGSVSSIVRLGSGQDIVVGSFTRLNGVPARNVARVNADGSTDSTFTTEVIDGTVNAVVAQSDGRLVIGGNFTNVGGQPRNGLARLNADGAFDPSFAPAVGYQTTNAVALQSDGKILVATSNSTFSFLARVNPDGTRDSSFNPAPNSFVRTVVVQSDGKIVVGGDFTTIGGVKRNRIARINADGTLDSTFNPNHGGALGDGFNNFVTKVSVLADGRILAAGPFTEFDGFSAKRIVRLTETGLIDLSWSPTLSAGTGADSTVNAIEVLADGRILIGGDFTAYSGVSRSRLARLDSNGALDTTFVPLAPSSTVNAILAQPDGTLLLGGSFTSFGGTTRCGLAQLSAEGTSLLGGSVLGTFNATGVSRVVPLPGGKLLVAGNVTHVNNTRIFGVFRLNADGSLDTGFTPNSGSSNVTDAFVQADGKVVVCGSFTVFGAGYVTRNRLARLNADGSLDPTFDPGAGPSSTPTRIIPLAGGKLLVCGSFTTYNNVARVNLARVNPDGSLDPTFDAGSAGFLSTNGVLPLPDGKLLLGGSFTTFNGVARNRLARLNPDGSLDPAFIVDCDSTVSALALQPDGSLLVGGSFTALNGVARARIGRLTAGGAVDLAFDPGIAPSSTVTNILLQEDGRMLIAGSFSSVNGYPNSGFVARLAANGSLDTTFSTIGLVSVPATLTMLDDGSLLLGDSYLRFGNAQRYGLVRTLSAPGPIIVQQPAGVSLLAGNSLTLSVSVAGGTGVTYQWRKDGTAIAGATAAAYTAANVQSTDAGGYSVSITAGGTGLTSATATVTVAASAPVSSGTISSFGGGIKAGTRWPLTAPTLTAGSTPLSYQWSKDGTSIPGATQPVFLPPTWQPADAGGYNVLVSNSLGSLPSTTFTQAVVDGPDWQWRFPLPQGQNVASVVFANGRFVTVGIRGSIMTSNDGVNWTLKRLGVSDLLTAIAYGNGTYVAIGQFGTVFTSTDAVNWTRRDAGVGSDARYFATGVHALTFANGLFVAVGTRGLVASSSDGIAWTVANAPTSDTLAAVAYNASKWVAVGTAGRTFTSTNATTWTVGVGVPESVSFIVAGAGLFVASGGTFAYTSPDGTAWTRRNLPTPASLRSLQFTDVGFVGSTSFLSPTGVYLVSPDGITWTRRTMDFSLNGAPNTMTHGASRYVAVGGTGDPLLSSADGNAWTRPGPASTTAFFAVAARTGTLVAVGLSGNIYSSFDGFTWTARTSGTTNSLNDITYAAGSFVAVGSAGTVVTSPDGIAWTTRTSGTAGTLRGVNYLNDRFYAVGDGGVLLTSTDGATWSAVASGISQNLFKSAYGAGTYVAVGAAGTVLSSTNGTAWSAQTLSGVTSDIRDVVFANGVFVLGSTGASIRTSTNGTTWTSRTNPLGMAINATAFAGAKFYLLSTGNTTYLTSTDGTTWTGSQNGCANILNDLVQFGDTIIGVGAANTILALELVASPPTIAVQPPSTIAALPGQTVNLSVSATGSGPLAYQWYKNNTLITGATNATLTLGNVQASDSGSYTVTITNSLGTATSSAANLALAPTFVTQFSSRSVGLGGRTTFTVVASGTSPLSFQWRKNDAPISGATNSTFTIDPVATANAGNYSVYVSNSAGNQTSVTGTLTVLPNPLGYSARQFVRADGLTGFFVIEGTQSKHVLLRALGPTLSMFGVSGVLGDPQITLFDANGQQLGANDNWGSITGVDWNALFSQVGASALPAGSLDSALHMTLAPGAYFARVTGVSGATGQVLLELYDLDLNPNSRLAYVGLRGRNEATGAMTGGLTVSNSANKRMLIRAVGPTLGTATAMVNPQLLVIDTSVTAASNDDWGGTSALVAAATQAGAFALPTTSTDAAVLVESRIGTGGYVAQVPLASGTGDVLLEFYDLAGTTVASFPPMVVGPPVSRSIVANDTATLRVLAVGGPTVAYQWRKGGAPISGATASTLVLGNVQAAAAGSYDVVVSNAAGSVTSTAAAITVVDRLVKIVSQTAVAGSTVVVPVQLIAHGDENALGFSVNFDSTQLAFASAAVGAQATDATLNVNSTQAGSGRLGFALGKSAGAVWAAGTQEIVKITFTLGSTVPNATVSALTFGDVPVTREIASAAAVTLPAAYQDGSITAFNGYEADMNGNGAVTVTDWVKIGRIVAGLDPVPAGVDFMKADCAPRSSLGNGALSITDWVQAGRYAAGLDPLTSVGGPSSQ